MNYNTHDKKLLAVIKIFQKEKPKIKKTLI